MSHRAISKKQFTELIEGYRADRPEAARWQDPEGASGECLHASADFAQYARARGHEAEVLNATQDTPKSFRGEHVVTRVGDRVVDWTFRQMAERAPVPLVRKYDPERHVTDPYTDAWAGAATWAASRNKRG